MAFDFGNANDQQKEAIKNEGRLGDTFFKFYSIIEYEEWAKEVKAQNREFEQIKKSYPKYFFDNTEISAQVIVKKLIDYPRIIENAIERFEPSQVAKYAVSLAQLFNKYYGNTRILEENAQLDARLALVKAMTIVLKDALNLLGIEAPEEM